MLCVLVDELGFLMFVLSNDHLSLSFKYIFCGHHNIGIILTSRVILAVVFGLFFLSL